MSDQNPEPLLNKKRVSDLLGVSRRQIERFVERRELKAIHIGRLVRFDPVDVRDFILRRKTRLAPLELKSHIASLIDKGSAS